MTASNVTDDIFARPPRSARRPAVAPTPAPRLVGRVACAVCDGRTDALICKECSELPDARAMVQGWLDANTAQRDALDADWRAFTDAHAADWDRLRQAQALPDYAARCDAHRKAKNVYGQLLDRHAAYAQAVQPLALERARLERALSILEGL